MQTYYAYLEAMLKGAALAQRLDEAEHLIYFGYEEAPAVRGPDDWLQTYDLELVKPRQPKLPPITQPRSKHMPLLPSRYPPFGSKYDAHLAKEAWRRKREYGWPVIKLEDGSLDVYMDRKDFSLSEFVGTDVLPVADDVVAWPIGGTPRGPAAQEFLG